MNYSVTYGGALVTLIGFILDKFGVPFATGELEQVVSAALVIGGVLVTFYGRWRHGDVGLLGFKLPMVVSSKKKR